VDKTVIEHVSKLALQNHAQITLLHVVHAHTLDQKRVLCEQAERTLGSYAQILKENDVDTVILIRNGEPEDEILAEVQSSDFDLVVMATHGHSLLSSLLFGSVSRSLRSRLTVPLLIINHGNRS
jgi:nucleotide-binding universal stress UspA family protein